MRPAGSRLEPMSSGLWTMTRTGRQQGGDVLRRFCCRVAEAQQAAESEEPPIEELCRGAGGAALVPVVNAVAVDAEEQHGVVARGPVAGAPPLGHRRQRRRRQLEVGRRVPQRLHLVCA